MDIAREHFENLLAPTHVIKTGNCTPETRTPMHYPFDPSTGNPDTFILSSHTWGEDGILREEDRAEARGNTDLSDGSIYHGQLKHTQKGKAPGPDKIHNKLLKILPDGWHKTIHSLFQIMWITGKTPVHGRDQIPHSYTRRRTPTW